MTRFFSDLCLTAGRRRRRSSRSPRSCPSRSPASPAEDEVRRHRSGRASSARTSPRRSQAAGHEVVGIDCFTDYYDPALKEENARGLDVRRLDLAADELELDGFDGVFHLAGQPGVRSFGDVFDALPARGTCSPPSASSRRRPRRASRVVFASSSSIYGEAERYPTPEDDAAATRLALRDHEARVRAPRARVRAQLRARRRRRSATSTPTARASGPTWRSRGSSTRSPTAGRSTLFGDGAQSRSFTYVADVVGGDDRSRWSGRRRSTLQRRRRRGGDDARDDRDSSSGSPAGTLDVRAARRSPGDQRRTKADTTRIRAELGWAADDVARGGPRAPSGTGPLVGSRRDERARERGPTSTPSGRSTSAPPGTGSPPAGGCPSLGLVLGLVLGFALALGGGNVYEAETLSTSASRSRPQRRRPDPEPRDEPAHGRRDHPLGGGAEARPRAASGIRVGAAARQRHSTPRSSAPARRAARRRSSRSPSRARAAARSSEPPTRSPPA